MSNLNPTILFFPSFSIFLTLHYLTPLRCILSITFLHIFLMTWNKFPCLHLNKKNLQLLMYACHKRPRRPSVAVLFRYLFFIYLHFIPFLPIDGCIREVELINNKREVLRRPLPQLYPLEIEVGTIDKQRKKVGQLRAKKKAITVPNSLQGNPVIREDEDTHAVVQQDAPGTKRGEPHDRPPTPPPVNLYALSVKRMDRTIARLESHCSIKHTSFITSSRPVSTGTCLIANTNPDSLCRTL